MSQIAVILGTPHTQREAGKRSPDGRLKEYLYGRELVCELMPKLKDYGIPTFVDMMQPNIPKNMQTPSSRLERQRELALRVNEVNSICDRYGKQNCIYVSLHVNAAASDNQWHNASGWQVCVSPQASYNSKLLATLLAEEATNRNLKVREPKPGNSYWEQSLYVLNRTHCPAVLTENLFQDNKDDVDFLLSDTGRHIIERLHIEGILRYINLIQKQS